MLDSLAKHYTVGELLGEGSFSKVMQVTEKGTKQKYAAKRLLRPFLTLGDVENYDELKTLLRFDHHPNILNLVEYVYEPNTHLLYLIFNSMDCSLFDYINMRHRRMSEQRCKFFLYHLSQGLLYLHQMGIFHRDIKPENILIKRDPKMKRSDPQRAELVQLSDFGSVGFVSSTLPHTEYVSTRWYRAPECILTAGFYGPKMDIWALGCCFYETLTLQPLFPGKNDIDQLDKIHKVFGSPSDSMLKRFKGLAMDFEFPRRVGVSWYKLLPQLSTHGIDILRRMLIYHPDTRISAKKLVEHQYFSDFVKKCTVNNSISARLFFTKSKGTSAISSTTTSKYSLSSSKSSQNDTIIHASESIRPSDIARKIRQDKEFSMNKERERNWNKTKSEISKSIMTNIRASGLCTKEH